MFVVVLLITIVGSILITWLLPMAIKSARHGGRNCLGLAGL
jgi:hypothetical protein